MSVNPITDTAYFNDALKRVMEAAQKAADAAKQSDKPASSPNVFGNKVTGEVTDRLETASAADVSAETASVEEAAADSEFEASLKKFEEETPKDRLSRKELFLKYKKEGLSDGEIYKALVKQENEYLNEDGMRLSKMFEKNPEIRIKYQENFDKLDKRQQKAVLAEVYTSNRNLDEAEINRLKKGLKSADDEVKFKVFSVLRNDERVSKEQYKKLAQSLDIDGKMLAIVDKLHEKYENGTHDKATTAAIVHDMCDSAELKSHERCKLAHEITEFQDAPDLQLCLGEELVNSKHIKSDEAAKNAIINTLPKYHEKNQVKITKTAYESENFDSTALRNSIISQIKYFTPANQKLASEFVVSSTKTEPENLTYLKNEVKSFDERVKEKVSQYVEKAVKKSENPNISASSDNRVKNAQNSALINTLASKSAAVNKPTTLIAFADALKKGIYSVAEIMKSSYSGAILQNIGALGRDEQLQAIYSAPLEQLAAMCTSGKLTGSLYEIAMERVKNSGNIDGKTANMLASSLSYKELKEMSKGNDKISDGIRTIFSDALNKRFSGLLELERAQNQRLA